MKLHRYFHSPAGAGHRGQPDDPRGRACARSARCRSCNIRKTENAVVTINTVYYGADPDVVAGFITTPLENAIAQANGIDYMTSTSRRRQHDHRQPAAELRCRQGADRDHHQDQFGAQPVADRRAAAGADRQVGQTIDAMYHRLRQRRAGAEPDHRLHHPQRAAAAAGGAGRADGGNARRPRISRCAPGSTRRSWRPTG